MSLGGRPPKGPKLARDLDGSKRAKRRLEAILETIAGTRTVREVAAELGICEAAFYKLRERTLQEAVEGLEPRPLGRRPHVETEADQRARELEEENEELRQELTTARVREEIAAILPGLHERRATNKPARKKGR